MIAPSRTAQGDDVVICTPMRTPVGRFRGVLSSLDAAALAVTVVGELIERTGIEPRRVDDVIIGQGYPSGEAPAIGRIVALDAGLGDDVPGAQVDRRCGSGLQAILNGAMQVATGGSALVLAGGTESMSNVEHYSTGLRNGDPAVLKDRLARARVTAGGRTHPIPGGMLETAENIRARFGITREAQDAYALKSQQAAATAQRNGWFDDEIVAVPVRSARGTVQVDVDEHPRPETTLTELASLTPIRAELDPTSTVTAGNASGQNDGAAMCIVTTRSTCDELGLDAMLVLRSWAVAGVAPEFMGLGPLPATRIALARAGLALDEVDLIELNEAFAVQVIACLQELGVSPEDHRVNVNGSGIALGHPIGATGARIVATLAHELRRRSGRVGLVTMCIGGGQGLTAVFERPLP